MMILLTGGSACGKSTYAEEICVNAPGPRWYLAAMQPYGEEGKRKVERHRKLRAGKGFETIERYTDYAALTLPARGTALLECICNLTANEMFDENGNMTDPYERVMAGVRHLRDQSDLLVVITNDVGSDGIAYEEGTEAYVRVLGRINADLAREADTVIEMVAGIPVLWKGELPL
ncbi:MAG: bifunctional adenosylcobinamide kinase/adenosylcobinamide-phosphate guanylyltransferase [Lachnospiraceae bacterium]|nr:bifunctional adenosylcobinamide kinase/adenosylcobinamide-phosphate guanylyltransferase [Lachnospiraceae bacterium]